MTKTFEVGQRVRILPGAHHSRTIQSAFDIVVSYNSGSNIVTITGEPDGDGDYMVSGGYPIMPAFLESLEDEPKVVDLSDVRAGDVVRVTRDRTPEFKETYEGEVSKVDESNFAIWFSNNNYVVYVDYPASTVEMITRVKRDIKVGDTVTESEAHTLPMYSGIKNARGVHSFRKEAGGWTTFTPSDRVGFIPYTVVYIPQ